MLYIVYTEAVLCKLMTLEQWADVMHRYILLNAGLPGDSGYIVGEGLG